jgi:type I restriction enzyme S subunit
MKWQETEFENLYLIPSKNGLTRPSAVRGAGYKFINMGEIFAHDRIGSIDMERVQMNEKELDSMLVEEGDLLFARQSLVLSGAGKCSIIQEIDEPTTFESHIIRVRLRKDIVDPRFYYYYFKSPICKIKSIVTQGVQAGIRGNDLKKLKVHVPSLETQQKIANILSKYDDLIENNRRRIELLEESARLLYREWFVYLRFPGHEHTPIIDGIPEGWEKGKISDLGEVITGKTPSKQKTSNFDGKIPFVKTPDMHNQVLTITTQETLSEEGANSQSKKFIPRGSVMVSCIGTVGIVSMSSSTCQTNQQINSIVFSDKLLAYYSFFLLKDIKPRLEAMGGGSTMPNINKQKFSSIPILISSKQLIDLFAENVKPSFEQIEKLSLMNQKLQQARDILLPRLMNGEIAV